MTQQQNNNNNIKTILTELVDPLTESLIIVGNKLNGGVTHIQQCV